MVKNQNLNSETILQDLKKLGLKHQKYLTGEGKWLIGGFESIISFDNKVSSISGTQVLLKKEIYMMLPVDIREEIALIMDVE